MKGTKISSEKSLHNYNFDSTPPYEVVDNKYISKEELDIIRKVEESLEKYHNKGCFKRSLEYLFIIKNLNPFDTFLKLTINSEKQLKYLNDDEAYKYLFEQLKDQVNEKEYLDLIKLDYLLKNKMKPKIWWNYSISKEERNIYFKLFNDKYNIDSVTFYNYSIVDVINDKIHLFIYKDNRVLHLSIKKF